MADCLSLLRQYNIQKKEIIERDDLIIFDAIAWPKNTKTNYAVYKTGQSGTPKEYYTLESLLFLLKNVSLSHPMYVQRAGNQSIPAIKLPDKRGLLAYLNGEVDSSQSIDRNVHLEMGIPAPMMKRSHDEPHQESIKKPRMETDEDKKRLAAKLGAKKDGGTITDQIHSLSDAMSKEKIAAIKAKRLAKKRATIKTDDDDIERTMDHGFVDDATYSIIKRERRHRTRASVLQSHNKTFSNIFSIAQSIKAREDGKGDSTSKQQPQMEQKSNRPIGTTLGYNRYDQERFGKEATGEFRIDTTRTYHGMTLKTMTEAATKTILEPPRKPQAPKEVPKPIDFPKPQRKVSSDNKSKTPIIIVPLSTTSLVTMLNVQELLEDLKYVSNEDKKASGMKKVSELTIHRKKPNLAHPGQIVSVPFKITDNPLRLSPQEWKQVVAVFVAGPTWQFKGWPGALAGGSPVDIFSKMKAFHVKFDEAKLDSNIQKWDVEVLQISKLRRHLDKACMLRFWECLERFMVKNFPDLRF